MSDEAVYRNPDNPAMIWQLDPEDPAQSEGLVKEYQDAVLDVLEEVIKRIEETGIKIPATLAFQKAARNHLTMSRYVADLLNAKVYDTIGIEAMIDGIVEDVEGEKSDVIAGVTMSAYQHGDTFADTIVKTAGGSPFVYKSHDENTLNMLTSNLGGSITKVTDEIKHNVSREVNRGLMAGEGEYLITKRMNAVLGEFNAKGRAEMIARTESLEALNRGAYDNYRNRGYKKYRVITAGADDRRCDDCGEKESMEYPIEDTFHIPPFHPRCRCTIVPVIEGLNDQKTLARQGFTPGGSGIIAKIAKKTLQKITKTPAPAKVAKTVETPTVKPVSPAVAKATPTPQPTPQEPITPAVSTPAPVKPLTKQTIATPTPQEVARANELIAKEGRVFFKDVNAKRFSREAVDMLEDEKVGVEVYEAYNAYTGGGYEDMNNILRGKATEAMSKMELEMLKDQTKKLDAAITKPIPEGVLYRGVGRRTTEQLLKSPIGSVCEDKGFQSYSINPDTASGFSGTYIAPTGTTRERVLVRAISDGKQLGIAGTDYESEVIIKPGTKWKIANKEVFTEVAGKDRMDINWHVITVVPA